jgi:hypothetical protein
MIPRDKSLQERVNLYCGACERWIVELNAAAQSGRLAYFITSRSVLRECHQMQRSLSDLEHSIIEMMSPQLTRKFADLITKYDSTFCKLNLLNEEEHNKLCIAMFRSVLSPYVYQYNDEIIDERLTQNLVFQTLDSVPGLRTLCLYYESNIDFIKTIFELHIVF